MSPPLADPDPGSETGAPPKPKRVCTPEQRAVNSANGRRSRGPGESAKCRTSRNATKHNLRAESDLVEGEDGDELQRRLRVWPELLGAETELEIEAAQHYVRMDWKVARAERSEDASTERRQLAITHSEQDGQLERARLLGLELESDVDPAGVVRKLLRSPAGCSVLLDEWTNIQTSVIHYNTHIWTRRERIFHLLSCRLADLFTFNQTLRGWLVAMLGIAYGNCGAAKAEKVGHVLEELKPAWMDLREFQLRVKELSDLLPNVATATEILRQAVAMVIDELTIRLKEAQIEADYDLELAHDEAEVDASADGARRLGYVLGRSRAMHAAHRRLQALQKDRREGNQGEALDPSEQPGADRTVTEGETAAVTEVDTLGVNEGQIGLITNDPKSEPAPVATEAAVTEVDTLGALEVQTGLITNDPKLPASASPDLDNFKQALDFRSSIPEREPPGPNLETRGEAPLSPASGP